MRAPRSPSHRIMVTGVSTFWGGRLAGHLEHQPGVDVVVALDRSEPSLPLERTEFVRTDTNYSALSRIVHAAQIDTILHTHLIVDSTTARRREVHETNVIGTMNLLAAASASPSVRKVVLKSSTLVYGADRRDPYYFREEHSRAGSPRTTVETSLVEAEEYVRDFVRDSPHVVTTILRFSNVVGGELETALTRLFDAPMVPSIFGYDPRLQLVHTEDVVGALEFCTEHDVPGVYNVAGDGIVPWSEVLNRLNKPSFLLPPIGTSAAAATMRRVVDMPPELQDLLRYGRGVDNRRLKAAGFRYRYTTAGALVAHVEEMRLRRAKRSQPAYHYESDVEQFLRRSSAVMRRDV